MSETEIPEDVREYAGAMSRLWWLSLVTGILWFFRVFNPGVPLSVVASSG
jgi:hypothetical protein